MAIKTASVTLDGEGMRFLGQVGSGHSIILDDGDSDTGARPSELVPLALAGCTAMDVISILRKKRQPVTRYEVRTSGEQRENIHPAAFVRIDVTHVVDGDVEVAAVARAIELSATKYCSVGATIGSGGCEIHHSYLVRRPGEPEQQAEVIVEGPYAGKHAAEAQPVG